RRDVHGGAVLEHPVAARDAGVERAALDVAGHLLRADEQAAEPAVVDAREVAARVDRDLPARATEELDGRVLEAALGNAELQDVHPRPPAGFSAITRNVAPPSSTRRKKQLR